MSRQVALALTCSTGFYGEKTYVKFNPLDEVSCIVLLRLMLAYIDGVAIIWNAFSFLH